MEYDVNKTVLFCLLLAAAGLLSCIEHTGGKTLDRTSRVHGYMSAQPYSRLIVELDYVEGHAPYEQVEQALIEKLNEIVDKPDGIAIVRDEVLRARGEDHTWTFAELQKLMRETDTLEVDEDEIKMHVVFVDGGYEKDDGNSKVLGLAWGNENIAMFDASIRSSCESPLIPGDRLCHFAQQAVWTHEIGHVLGLVDNGAPLTADHADEEHGAHCTNDKCVMYWAYEGSRIIDVLRERLLGGNDSPLDFDQNCRNDLKAVTEGH